MDTRFIKIPLAFASLAYAIFLFTEGYIGSGVGMVFVTTLIVLITLQSMRLLMAFVSLRQQKMEDARKWLGDAREDGRGGGGGRRRRRRQRQRRRRGLAARRVVAREMGRGARGDSA